MSEEEQTPVVLELGSDGGDGIAPLDSSVRHQTFAYEKLYGGVFKLAGVADRVGGRDEGPQEFFHQEHQGLLALLLFHACFQSTNQAELMVSKGGPESSLLWQGAHGKHEEFEQTEGVSLSSFVILCDVKRIVGGNAPTRMSDGSNDGAKHLLFGVDDATRQEVAFPEVFGEALRVLLKEIA